MKTLEQLWKESGEKVKKKLKRKPPIRIEYDGMGTCVEAAIYAGQTLICVVHTHNPAMNQLTTRAAKAIKRSFERTACPASPLPK